MCFQDFELLTDKPFTVKCKTCGEEIPTGVISISQHWGNCTGKEFHAALMSLANDKKGKVTLDDVEVLQNKHLK